MRTSLTCDLDAYQERRRRLSLGYSVSPRPQVPEVGTSSTIVPEEGTSAAIPPIFPVDVRDSSLALPAPTPSSNAIPSSPPTPRPASAPPAPPSYTEAISINDDISEFGALDITGPDEEDSDDEDMERPAFRAAFSTNFQQQRFATESVHAAETEDLPDLDNVQGDVIYLFPKKAENFIFFRIADVQRFKSALISFKPSSSNDVANFLKKINDEKAKARAESRTLAIIPNAQQQIAFTRMGMNYLGEKGKTGDARFDLHAMRDDREYLGDQAEWDPVFNKPDPDPVSGSAGSDKGALHGVFSVSGSDPDTCTAASKAVADLFGSSITVIETMEGRARPKPYVGHEHFGFEDGVSQPALRGRIKPNPGQIEVDPGVIILGYKGDPLVDDPSSSNVQRPAWCKDGTMMVFRKLQQFVPEFDDYCVRNGKRWREFAPGGDKAGLTDDEGKELWGARLIGRWKSGAPLQVCPLRDDAKLGADAMRNNDFDYHIRNDPSISSKKLTDKFCPFTAHTRKTAPRSLNPYIQKRFLESGMIVRAGLPYGIEVTNAEKQSKTTSNDKDKERGLLFVSYQSSLDSGFVRQTVAMANNDFFPTTSLLPVNLGQDPIIGGPPAPKSAQDYTEVQFVNDPSALPKSGEKVNWKLKSKTTGEEISVTGFAGVKAQGASDPPGVPQEFFVTSHGGEYFFVPPIKTLKKWASGESTSLDIMFVLDATSSMQRFIDQARHRINSIVSEIVQSGNWSSSDLRVGLIAFRDHPQKDRSGNEQSYGFVSKSFGFYDDPEDMKAELGKLEASGGGDGPEAQCDALDDALNASWKDDATKVVVLVTDSPPHAIDEYEDKVPECPNQNDPVRSTNMMRDQGITLHVIACEPTLSGSYSKAHDFYVGVTRKTGGQMVALSDESTLSNLIVGRVTETADIQRAAIDHRNFVVAQAKKNESFDSISKEVFKKLSQANVKLNKFDVESVYESKSVGDENANVWFEATKINKETKDKIKTVTGSRLKQEYRRNGAKAGTAQAMSLSQQPVTQDQADQIVKFALARK